MDTRILHALVAFLIQPKSDSIKQLVDSVSSFYNKKSDRNEKTDTSTTQRTPEELRYLYDTYIRKEINQMENAIIHNSIISFKETPILLSDSNECFFIIALHLLRERRINELQGFLNYLYDKNIKRYMFLSFDYRLFCFDRSRGIDDLVKTHNANTNAEQLSFTVYNEMVFVDCVYSFLTVQTSGEFSEYYNYAREVVRKRNAQYGNYAYYYFIEARIRFFAFRNKFDDTITLEYIRDLLKKAIDFETYTEIGVQNRSAYMALFLEVNSFEIIVIKKEHEQKIQVIEKTHEQKIASLGVEYHAELKDVEAKSFKRFSTFSAFVSFAVGLISKFATSPINFNETLGYIFVLFGISVAIFAVLDLIVLGPHSEYYDRRLWEDRHEKRMFACKAAAESALCIVPIVIGILIGKGIILH